LARVQCCVAAGTIAHFLRLQALQQIEQGAGNGLVDEIPIRGPKAMSQERVDFGRQLVAHLTVAVTLGATSAMCPVEFPDLVTSVIGFAIHGLLATLSKERFPPVFWISGFNACRRLKFPAAG
jgi:hypothetical protein